MADVQVFASREEMFAAFTAGVTADFLVRGGITVLPHVQRFADAAEAATGVTSWGTYPGHDPSAEQALDAFVPVSTRTLGDALCDFALAHWDEFAMLYQMFRQRITSNDDRGWRPQSPYDRGSLTANHYDHVHLSFKASAPKPAPAPKPEIPKPQPQQEDDTMRLIGVTNNRGIFLVGNSPLATGKAKGKVPAVYIGTPEEVGSLNAAGAAVRDESKPDLPEAVFDRRFIVVG